MKGLQTLWGLRSFIIVFVLLTHTPTLYGAERIRNGRNSSNGQDERSLQRKRNNNRTPSPHRQRTSSQHLINSLAVAQQPTNHHHHHIEDQHTEFVKGKSSLTNDNELMKSISRENIASFFTINK
uniref:Uncharacterized protein n=1 Tax=Glossina brevipalpis TaxID=37001 RepID=A0A1A9X3V3_9MUSC